MTKLVKIKYDIPNDHLEICDQCRKDDLLQDGQSTRVLRILCKTGVARAKTLVQCNTVARSEWQYIMILEYMWDLSEINGPLIALDGMHGRFAYEEMVGQLELQDGTTCARAVWCRWRGTGLRSSRYSKVPAVSLCTTPRTHHSWDSPWRCRLSTEMLGRVFDGSGRPIDGLGEIYWEKRADINGKPHEPGVPRISPKLHQHRYFRHRLC